MKTRIISGILLAALVIALIEFAPLWLLRIIVVMLSFVAAYELLRLLAKNIRRLWLVMAMMESALLTTTGIFYARHGILWLLVLALIFASACLYFMRQSGSLQDRLYEMISSVFAVIFVGVFFAFWGLVIRGDDYRFWLYLMLGATFAADTGAYFSGRFFGKHKMAPEISPGKTWEGYFGGVLMAMLAGLICSQLFSPGYPLTWVMGWGALLGLVGPWGDLSESFLKRAFAVKDISHLIPGHGGLLDRVDALLFTAPVVVVIKSWLER